MSLSPWLDTRSEFEFWLHGSSRYSAVGQMRPPNEVIVKQQEVTTLDNQFQGDVFKYEPFWDYNNFGEPFFLPVLFGGVLKGEVWRSKFSLRRLVTDNFPPKAGKSLARMVRPHNEVTTSPIQFAVLEQEALFHRCCAVSLCRHGHVGMGVVIRQSA